MARRRMLAPISTMWDDESTNVDEQEAARVMARLQERNMAERMKEAERSLAAIENPGLRQPRGQRQGLLHWGSSPFGATPELMRENRQRDQSINNLLGTAQAMSMLNGQTQMHYTNALPDTVNNIDPRGYRPGTEGGARSRDSDRFLDRTLTEGAKAEAAALKKKWQRRGLEDRPQSVTPLPVEPEMAATEQEPPPWSASSSGGDLATTAALRAAELHRNRQQLGLEDAPLASEGAGGGWLTTEQGDRYALSPAMADEDEEERRRRELAENYRRNRMWRSAEPTDLNAPYRRY